mgnify:CR=1 FL=1
MRRNTRVSRAYRAFHGAEPVRERRFSFTLPKRFWKMGLLEELRYSPEYPSQHKKVTFRHAFPDYGNGEEDGPKPLLAASEDGNVLLVIRDRSKFKVGRRGIVG